MSKIDCYDKEGTLHLKEPVDARECCDTLGWTMDKPVPKAKRETAKEKKARLALIANEPSQQQVSDPVSTT